MQPNHRLFLSMLALLIAAGSLAAQETLALQESSVISLDGTSSLHSWTMTAEEGLSKGEAQFVLDGSTITGLESLQISLPAESLKSGKPPLDANAYKALNTTEHPSIDFVMNKLGSVAPEGEGFKMDVEGDLTIAGNTQQVTLPATCQVEGSTVSCSGSIPLLMTQFGITPPSVMLGTIKSGDEIVISYEAVFAK